MNPSWLTLHTSAQENCRGSLLHALLVISYCDELFSNKLKMRDKVVSQCEYLHEYTARYRDTIITNNGNIKPSTIVDDQVKDQVMSIPQDIPTSSAAITEVKGDCNALKSWLKIGTIALHDTDKQMAVNGSGVATHLTAVQLILKSQFFNINGLEDTALVLRKGNTIITESYTNSPCKWKSLDNYFNIRFCKL